MVKIVRRIGLVMCRRSLHLHCAIQSTFSWSLSFGTFLSYERILSKSTFKSRFSSRWSKFRIEKLSENHRFISRTFETQFVQREKNETNETRRDDDFRLGHLENSTVRSRTNRFVQCVNVQMYKTTDRYFVTIRWTIVASNRNSSTIIRKTWEWKVKSKTKKTKRIFLVD